MTQQFNPAVQGQLAHNASMRQLHAQSQARLDVIRLGAVARSAAAVAQVQMAGEARNVLAGMLPTETRPRVRKQLARFASDFTVLKAARAGEKVGR